MRSLSPSLSLNRNLSPAPNLTRRRLSLISPARAPGLMPPRRPARARNPRHSPPPPMHKRAVRLFKCVPGHIRIRLRTCRMCLRLLGLGRRRLWVVRKRRERGQQQQPILPPLLPHLWTRRVVRGA